MATAKKGTAKGRRIVIDKIGRVLGKHEFGETPSTTSVKRAVAAMLDELGAQFGKVTVKTIKRDPFFGPLAEVIVHEPVVSASSEGVLSRIRNHLITIKGRDYRLYAQVGGRTVIPRGM
jgi:hypothetical protein